MATIDLDHIEFYSPNPPPSQTCFKPIISTGIPTSSRPMCTPSSTFPALRETAAQTEPSGQFERPFASPPAPTLTGSTVQLRSESARAAQTDFDRKLEELGVVEIETVDLTRDDSSLDSLLSWASEELCRSPSPSGSFASFEVTEKHGNTSDGGLFVPQSPFLGDGDSIVASTAPPSASGALPDGPRSNCRDQPGLSSTQTLIQPDMNPNVSTHSASPVPQTETRNSEASDTVACYDQPAQRLQRFDTQSSGHTRIEVVIPSKRYIYHSLSLEIPDGQGPVGRKSSLIPNSGSHGNMDTERADSDEELDPPAQQGKRWRVSSPSSTRRHCRSTVSASATDSPAEGLPGHMSIPGDYEGEGSERADPGFVQPRHKEDAQDDRVASLLHIAGHAPTSAEGAMTLASAVALELYSLLMRPPARTVVAPSHGDLSSAHVSASYEERMSDQGRGRARWSKEEDKLLFSLRKNTPWREIERKFPRRTPGSLRQRCSMLNRRLPPSDRRQRKVRRS